MTSAIDSVSSQAGLGGALANVLKIELWGWVDANQDQKVFTVSLLKVVRKTFYVRDLDEVFTLILGPRP